MDKPPDRKYPTGRLNHVVAAVPLLLAFLGGGLGLRGAPASDSALRAENPRCEFDAAPLGIDEPRPRLSWTVASDARGERQSAWEIQAASSARGLQDGHPDLWDSGREASDQTAYVAYGGPPLASSQQVFWRLRVWDREGRPSPWTEPASWTMGLLSPADWHGVWIAAPGATESLLLRTAFAVRPGLRRALVDVCGLGQYEILIDGRKAGQDLLSPGWTDYDRTDLYDTRDITRLLRPGANALGLFLGNGMYNVVRRDRFIKFAGSFGALRAILSLRLEYADGTVDYVGTNPGWRTHPGPITEGNIYSGEDYDARLELPGWSRPGFDDDAWSHAVAIVRPEGALLGHSAAAEPLRPIAEQAPVGLHPLPDGSVVYDLGQNTSYMPRITVEGPRGSAIRLTPAEVTNPDGTINTDTMDGKGRGPAWWQYTKATDRAETWFPHFYYVGCRYLKAEFFPAEAGGPPPRLVSLVGVMVHSSSAPVGRFDASNPLLGRIRELVRWAQMSNMVSVLTDCPHREKLGWLEQYHLNGPAIRYEFDLARLFAKGMHDMADEQTEEGLIPNIAPEYVKFDGAFRAAPAWGAAFILVPWQQYEFTGDAGPLRDHFGQMKRYFSYLESRARDGILSEGLGDWFDLGPNPPGPAQLTPPPVTATAFFYQDAAILAEEAQVLGRSADAAAYREKAARIRQAFNRRFFHPDTGSYAAGSQCANALALVMGVVPDHERPRVLAALQADVARRGYEMSTGDVGFRYLLQALAQGGRSDTVYRIIDQDDKPGYGYMLKQGATALTESWDANRHTSQDHFMLGQINEWFYRDLAGIAPDPAGPGFKRILIHPAPVGDLAWAEASYDSIRGPISVRWDRQGDRFTLHLAIPANTTATVFLPAADPSHVREGGRPLARSPDVTLLRQQGDRAVLAVESGRYRFESRLR